MMYLTRRRTLFSVRPRSQPSGFCGSNPAAITVQGSQLAAQPGQGIALVGGNITVQNGTLDNGTVQPAKLTAPGGQIHLASVGSPGEILTGTLDQAANINGQSFGALGTVQVTQKSVIDSSGSGGGTVLIRGGRFVLDNSTISANVTASAVGQPGAGIDVSVTQDAIIQNAGVPPNECVAERGNFSRRRPCQCGSYRDCRHHSTAFTAATQSSAPDSVHRNPLRNFGWKRW